MAVTTLPKSTSTGMAQAALKPPHHHAAVARTPTPRRGSAKTKVPKPAALGEVAIQGSVKLVASSGQPVSAADMANTLVYFVPSKASARTHPGHYTIYTDHHQFDPRAMAIPQGSTISFVNLDSVDHNVYSATPGNTFNLGYQAHGQTASHTFEHAGLVLISCNVHPSMEVDVLVEPTPYVATVAADGSFVLRGLPTGSGTLYAWNPRARITREPISLPRTAPVQLHLSVTRPRVSTTLYTGKQP